MTQDLPQLGSIGDLAQALNVSEREAYSVARRLPRGVGIKVGRRWRFNMDRLNQWLRVGGHLAQ